MKIQYESTDRQSAKTLQHIIITNVDTTQLTFFTSILFSRFTQIKSDKILKSFWQYIVLYRLEEQDLASEKCIYWKFKIKLLFLSQNVNKNEAKVWLLQSSASYDWMAIWIITIISIRFGRNIIAESNDIFADKPAVRKIKACTTRLCDEHLIIRKFIIKMYIICYL